MHLGQPNVACLAQAHPPRTLGKCPFDAHAPVVAGFPLGSLLLGSQALQGFVVSLNADAQLPGLPSGPCTVRSHGAAATDRPGKLTEITGLPARSW